MENYDNIFKDFDAEAINDREAIRIRPGMYVGSTGSAGIEHLVQELVANIIDLYLSKNATRVELRIGEHIIEVIDDGPGLPFDEPSNKSSVSKAEYFLTRLHFTYSADEHSPHIHLLNSGVGLLSVNALSCRFHVQSWREGNLWEQVFVRGRPKGKAKIIEKNKTARGSIIKFAPDPEIFGTSRPRIGVIRSILFQASHLFPGLQIIFNGERFCSPNGLGDLAYIYGKKSDNDFRSDLEPFSLTVKNEKIEIQVACLGKSSKKETEWYSWVNGSKTDRHGTHLTGLKYVLTKAKWKPSVGLIHVIFLDPEYSGPVRDKLIVNWVQSEVRKNLLKPILAFCKKSD